jgi:hypothetical protein
MLGTEDFEDLDDLGTYWTPPVQMEMLEAHPNLIRQVLQRPGADIKLFYASLFEMPSACPIGFLEVAIDLTRGEACGVYPFHETEKTTAQNVEMTNNPFWVSSKPDLDDTMIAVYEHLRAEGILQ